MAAKKRKTSKPKRSPPARPRRTKARASHAAPTTARGPTRAPAKKRVAAERSNATDRPAARPPYYLTRLARRGGVSVWSVDGAYIRKNVDEEFTNFGHHWSIDRIPRGEIWIDQEAHPDEQRFFVRHAIVERHLMSRGADYDAARLKADAEERAMRSRAGDLRKASQAKGLADSRACLRRLWKRLENGIEVWFVDGRLVRSVFDIEFTEGGHDYVYEFVPSSQVWIDDDVHESERGFVLFHELHERNLMAKGMAYNAAHADSSRLEKRYRNHPAQLHEALSGEGWD
ncbi:MAG: hypothetical protein NVS1B4_07610 [Gemmatimonadaceae bacterium]